MNWAYRRILIQVGKHLGGNALAESWPAGRSLIKLPFAKARAKDGHSAKDESDSPGPDSGFKGPLSVLTGCMPASPRYWTGNSGAIRDAPPPPVGAGKFRRGSAHPRQIFRPSRLSAPASFPPLFTSGGRRRSCSRSPAQPILAPHTTRDRPNPHSHSLYPHLTLTRDRDSDSERTRPKTHS